MAVDAEELLVVEGSKDLTQCGLSAPCLTDQEYWLLVPEALVDEDCKPPQLPADDKSRYSKVGWRVFECLAQVILLEVGVIELLFVYLALQRALDSLLDELFVLWAPRPLAENKEALEGDVLSHHSLLIFIHPRAPLQEVSDCDRRVLSRKQTALRSVDLQALHCLDHQGSSALWEAAFLLKNILKLISGNISNFDQNESILERL